jgi:hypothetical protein
VGRLYGAAIRAAAARAVILWPEEPEIDPGGGAWSSATFTPLNADEPGSEAELHRPGAEGDGT